LCDYFFWRRVPLDHFALQQFGLGACHQHRFTGKLLDIASQKLFLFAQGLR